MKRAYLGIVLSTAIFLTLTGCGSVEDKIAEKATEGIAEKAVGGKVDITKDGVKIEKEGVTYETGQDLKWPKESMGDIPEPKAEISAILNADADKGGTVAFTDMSIEDAKKYVEKLKELGYKDGMSFADKDMFSHSGKNSSGASVMFTYSISPKEGSIMYSAGGTE